MGRGNPDVPKEDSKSLICYEVKWRKRNCTVGFSKLKIKSSGHADLVTRPWASLVSGCHRKRAGSDPGGNPDAPEEKNNKSLSCY